MTLTPRYGRLRQPPDPVAEGARLAVQIVMNYEEGSEYSIPDGDGTSEMYLTEVPGATVGPGKRDLIVESVYEYGSRAGFWRLMRMFAERNIDITVFGAALALERNPEAARAIVAAGHEVCSHGWRWVGFKHGRGRARADAARGGIDQRTIGQRPQGWYCRYAPSENTRHLVVERAASIRLGCVQRRSCRTGSKESGKDHLVIPTLDVNDMKFSVARLLGAVRTSIHARCVRRALRRRQDGAEDDRSACTRLAGRRRARRSPASSITSSPTTTSGSASHRHHHHWIKNHPPT